MQHFEQDENGVWVLKEEVAGRGREAVIKVSSEDMVRKEYRNVSLSNVKKIERQFHNMSNLEHTGRVPKVYALYEGGYLMEYLKNYITLRLAVKIFKKNKDFIKELLREVYKARLELGRNISISDMSEDNTLVNIDTMDVKFIDIGDIKNVPSGYLFDLETKIINLLGVDKLWKLVKKEFG